MMKAPVIETSDAVSRTHETSSTDLNLCNCDVHASSFSASALAFRNTEESPKVKFSWEVHHHCFNKRRLVGDGVYAFLPVPRAGPRLLPSLTVRSFVWFCFEEWTRE